MSKPAYTAGPWQVHQHKTPTGTLKTMIQSDTKNVASVDVAARDYGRTDADAHLIAAAPDLHAACRAALDFYDESTVDFLPDMARQQEIIAMLRAALAKADNGAANG